MLFMYYRLFGFWYLCTLIKKDSLIMLPSQCDCDANLLAFLNLCMMLLRGGQYMECFRCWRSIGDLISFWGPENTIDNIPSLQCLFRYCHNVNILLNQEKVKIYF